MLTRLTIFYLPVLVIRWCRNHLRLINFHIEWNENCWFRQGKNGTKKVELVKRLLAKCVCARGKSVDLSWHAESEQNQTKLNRVDVAHKYGIYALNGSSETKYTPQHLHVSPKKTKNVQESGTDLYNLCMLNSSQRFRESLRAFPFIVSPLTLVLCAA